MQRIIKSKQINPKTQDVSVHQINPILNENQEPSTLKECRICLQSGQDMIDPCFCDGSIAWVHQKCIILYACKKLENSFTKQPRHIKYRCQLCHYEIYFQYTIQMKLNCNPLAEGKRFSTWLVLLILLALFSLLQTLLLIMIIVYYNGFTNSPLFAQNKVWIIITTIPLLTLGLLMISFYFVCQNLYGVISIVRAISKGRRPKNEQKGSCIPLIGYVLYGSEKAK